MNLIYMIVAQSYPEKEKKKTLEQAQGGEITLMKSATAFWTKEEIQKLLENSNSIVDLRNDYLSKYEKHSLIAYQIEKWCFYYAVYSYILFKISNYSSLSLRLILLISAILIIIKIILLFLYKRLLRNN